MMGGRARIPALAVLATLLAGCHAGTGHAAAAAGPHLSAILSSPTDVTLRWSGLDPRAAGAAMEFATAPDGTYSTLEFEPADRDTARHPDLMPQTTFYYRLRPYFGPVSSTVDVVLPPGDFDENAHQSNPDWGVPRTEPRPGPTGSIRVPGAGAPTDLRATVMDPNGILFRWTDHASDEQGYLVEVRPAGVTDFEVAAVLDPDVNTYGLVTLPNEKHASYRVRAFYYGPASNIAQQTTGG